MKLFTLQGKELMIEGKSLSTPVKHFGVEVKLFVIPGKHVTIQGRHFTRVGKHLTIVGKYLTIQGKYFTIMGRGLPGRFDPAHRAVKCDPCTIAWFTAMETILTIVCRLFPDRGRDEPWRHFVLIDTESNDLLQVKCLPTMVKCFP